MFGYVAGFLRQPSHVHSYVMLYPDQLGSPLIETEPRVEREQVVSGRRGKPWVPWEQLWQVGRINYKNTITKIKDIYVHTMSKQSCILLEKLRIKRNLIGCTLSLSCFNSGSNPALKELVSLPNNCDIKEYDDECQQSQ